MIVMKPVITCILTFILLLSVASTESYAQYSYDGHRCINVDDYSQYAPLVAGLGLGVAGVKAEHNFTDRLLVEVTSFAAIGIMVKGLKVVVNEERPDGSDYDSFPSGHSAKAFMGAEIVRVEYGLGYGLAAYAVALGTAFLRVYNGRHHVWDVIAGAGIGVFGARIGYWLLPPEKKLTDKIFRKKKDMSMSVSPVIDPVSGIGGVALALAF